MIRIASRTLLSTFVLLLILSPVVTAQDTSDPYHVRVFWREKTEGIFIHGRPYLDWNGTASRPCNFYAGTIPMNPNDPFEGVATVDVGQNGVPSLFDPTFQRRGYQFPDGDWRNTCRDGDLCYYLMSSSGDARSCGYGGSLGKWNPNAEDLPWDQLPDRPGAGGDLCEAVGRAVQVGRCALEFQEAEIDELGNYHWLERTNMAPAAGYRCPNQKPVVILMNLSTMW